MSGAMRESARCLSRLRVEEVEKTCCWRRRTVVGEKTAVEGSSGLVEQVACLRKGLVLLVSVGWARAVPRTFSQVVQLLY